MLDQSTLEALRDTFWPIYFMAVATGALSAAVTRRWCLGRAVGALVAGSLAQWAWEPANGYLLWWQHLAISLPIFVLVTLPPRHYWQSTLGALVFAQIVLHCMWGVAPDLGRVHWLGCILIGFAKCAVLLLWSGGSSVESTFGRLTRPFARLVLASSQAKLAR